MVHAAHRPLHNRLVPAARLGAVAGSICFVAVLAARSTAPPPPVEVEVPAVQPAPAPLEPVVRVLRGPNHEVKLPLEGPVVVHVWLENCPDCMPAFAAHRELMQRHAFDEMNVLNVAYGRVDDGFAARYRVDRNLVIDEDGAALVRPYGIGSFTTLVLDGQGAEVWRGRPDTTPAYQIELRAAWAKVTAKPTAAQVVVERPIGNRRPASTAPPEARARPLARMSMEEAVTRASRGVCKSRCPSAVMSYTQDPSSKATRDAVMRCVVDNGC